MMHIEPDSGLRFYPCEANGCFYAKDARGTLHVAPMLKSGEPDFDAVSEFDPRSEIAAADVEAFLALQGAA